MLLRPCTDHTTTSLLFIPICITFATIITIPGILVTIATHATLAVTAHINMTIIIIITIAIIVSVMRRVLRRLTVPSDSRAETFEQHSCVKIQN